MIRLEFFKQEYFSEVNYTLDDIQSKYTSTAAFALQRIKDRNTGLEHPVTIFDDDKPVGFFTLDFGEDKLDITDNKNAVLLRSLSVNPNAQGKGIGKSAMILVDDFVKNNFINCDEIVLTVNQNNPLAYNLYIQVGYLYEGKTKIGRIGPQYLMYKKL
ncbi:GNAT family N-acetyltransferase [Chryseobacterium sp. JUb7]|uniref:GNAT family N-acetyltransferase n=1 Tax=Chryseobacterium sp. JUb7 TaxID=2940599 RepID=UPI00216A4BB4|nr:GNAT family N-acetyltransferase [Chryseobacterium sp. JUb7]MCS3529947.1 RimJ/RimL family protein N-acetyltransferase [Chryseobacterium sp. JUb7]